MQQVNQPHCTRPREQHPGQVQGRTHREQSCRQLVLSMICQILDITIKVFWMMKIKICWPKN